MRCQAQLNGVSCSNVGVSSCSYCGELFCNRHATTQTKGGLEGRILLVECANCLARRNAKEEKILREIDAKERRQNIGCLAVGVPIAAVGVFDLVLVRSEYAELSITMIVIGGVAVLLVLLRI